MRFAIVVAGTASATLLISLVLVPLLAFIGLCTVCWLALRLWRASQNGRDAPVVPSTSFSRSETTLGNERLRNAQPSERSAPSRARFARALGRFALTSWDAGQRNFMQAKGGGKRSPVVRYCIICLTGPVRFVFRSGRR